jgi:hypothetical protein
MRILLRFSLSIPFLLATVAIGPCDSKPLGSAVIDSGMSNGHDAAGAVACNDGTMQTDCCPDSVTSGSSCNLVDLADCWTPCANGYRSHYFCGGSGWSLGRGLYDCTGDTRPSDGGSGPGDARPSDGGPADVLPSSAISCMDGTGLTDCCPDGVTESSACSGQLVECWTKCYLGSRARLSCGAGVWSAGRGLYPCAVKDAAGGDGD